MAGDEAEAGERGQRRRGETRRPGYRQTEGELMSNGGWREGWRTMESVKESSGDDGRL